MPRKSGTPKYHKSTNSNWEKTSTGKRKSKQKIRETPIQKLKKDLQDPNTMAYLGEQPIYLHNNKQYAEWGLESAVNHLRRRMETTYFPQVRAAFKEQKSILTTKEQLFFSNPTVKAEGVTDMSTFREWWATKLMQDSGADFQEYFNAIIATKEFSFNLVTNQAGDKDSWQQELVKALKIIFSFKPKDSAIRAEINKLKDALLQAGYVLQNDELVFTGSSTKAPNWYGIWARLGWLFEQALGLSRGILEEQALQTMLAVCDQAIQESGYNSGYGRAAPRIQTTHVGQRSKSVDKVELQQGASDILLTAGSVTVGISAKLRHVVKKIKIGNKDTYRVYSRAGTNATATTLKQWFINPNNTFTLSKKDERILCYALYNWQNAITLNGATALLEIITQYFFWQRALFAILGENYKTMANIPVFLASGHNIFRTIDILTYILNTNYDEIDHLKTQGRGAWAKKDHNTWPADQVEALWNTKKLILSRNRTRKRGHNQETVTYKFLKNKLLASDLVDDEGRAVQRLKNAQPIGIVAISYQILLENIKQLQK